jgi:two-component system response regulator FlrC
VGSPAELRLVAERALERRHLLAFKARAEQADAAAITLSWGAPAMASVVAGITKVAKTSATVLLLGESGTGKEMVARAIHRQSARAGAAFAAINCATLSESLLESELFGHERGAFTGAHAVRRGRLELAEGGTFFLDEIAELKLDLQSKLLRVVQERTFERIGGNRTLSADVRWIAATNRDLQTLMREGRFRADLYHRLAVFPVWIPPLRERREDILPLAERLLTSIALELGRPRLTLSESARQAVESAAWPGNVRELRNTLERAAILCDGGSIEAEHVLLEVPATSTPSVRIQRLEELERQAILQALASADGNRKAAATALGIGLRTLYDKLKRYGAEST